MSASLETYPWRISYASDTSNPVADFYIPALEPGVWTNSRKKAASAQQFTNKPGFARVVSIEDIAVQDYSLSILLYVRRMSSNGTETEAKPLKQVWSDWEESGSSFWQGMDSLVKMLDGLVK